MIVKKGNAKMDFLVTLIVLAMIASFVRLFIGPDFADRIVAFDTTSIMSISLLVLLSIQYKSAIYLDVAFVFALIGFIGTILFARFNILRGKDA
jgi:multisubunit Na+/H+ antiporter MnhF subunit